MLKIRLNSRKIKAFISRYKISGGIILVSLTIFLGFVIYLQTQNVAAAPSIKRVVASKAVKEVKVIGVPAPLTGIPVDKSLADRTALGAIIENFPDARPQSGYNEADLVYETLAEGGITRTMAVYQSQNSKEIGPIRSARTYFVDWLSEVGGIFAHVGGNADALDLIKEIKIPDLNQFAYGDYYRRSTDRFAPHNVYTSTEKLYSAAKVAGYSLTAPPTAITFKDDIALKSRPATQSININFSGPDYAVSYAYDPKDNGYLRSVAGEPCKDLNSGIQVKPKNVAVQFTSITPYINYAKEQGVQIQTTGNGLGYVFLDGKPINATWTKDSRTSRTRFFDSENKEILFNKGQTWFEIVPTGQSVTY